MPRWELDPNRLPKWLGPLRSLARKELHLWVDGWIQDRLEKLRWPKARGTRHLLLSICDHYEPLHGHVSRDVGVLRVKVWHEQYPKMADRFATARAVHQDTRSSSQAKSTTPASSSTSPISHAADMATSRFTCTTMAIRARA